MQNRTSTLAFVLLTIAMPASAQTAAERGAALFGQQCALCHAASEDTGGGQGPNLAGVAGRRAGSAAFGYSRAMAHAGLTWDASTLDRYLARPSAVVSGTSMPAHVDDAADRRDIVAYLATLHGGAAAASQPDATATSMAVPGRGATLTGAAAFGDWHTDAPGVRRRIVVGDLPPPFATRSAGNSPRIVDRPAGAMPRAPDGFRVDLFADGFDNPRLLRVAPNGDIFLSETAAGHVRVLRAADGANSAAQKEMFARGLDAPFGIAFYPPGPDPAWVYVAMNNSVVRFPYRNGDVRARGEPETIVARLAPTSGGHTTRDIAFSPDGQRLYVSVGSRSNVAESMGERPRNAAEGALGAAWGSEENRADVLAFTPDGKRAQVFATGLRNCVGMAVQPGSGALWCSTNERDGMGDDLVPDYITRVREGGFYGWPWFYLGDHEDPRLAGQRPDLRGKIDMPDVLIQPHSASLQMTFQQSPAFPPEWRGAFASEHGSWNRAKRTGYKVIHVVLGPDGAPTGEYDDFLVGFVANDNAVWGRPVGVAVAHDGALLVSEDANGTIWRVAYTGRATNP